MKKACLFSTFVALSLLGYAEESVFLLSSEPIVQQSQGSLKGLRLFNFFPILKVEGKNADKMMELINQELKKEGLVIKKPILTPEGADLDSFSRPTLRFTVEQLVDQNNKLLPVLQATLSINSVAELSGTKELSPLNTNRWSIYLDLTNNAEAAVKKALPALLKQFALDFQRANTAKEKPTFYIGYDASWWKTPS
jgi:hypothetical protein